MPHDLRNLPGYELIHEGLRDLTSGVESVPALLVAIGSPKLRDLGLVVPPTPTGPEHRLYAMLSVRYGNAAHSQYNALIRRLVSFERALACVR